MKLEHVLTYFFILPGEVEWQKQGQLSTVSNLHTPCQTPSSSQETEPTTSGCRKLLDEQNHTPRRCLTLRINCLDLSWSTYHGLDSSIIGVSELGASLGRPLY